MTNTFDIRTLTDADIDAILEIDESAFGTDISREYFEEYNRPNWDLDRFIAAVEHTPVSETDVWAALLERWLKMGEVLHHHHAVEARGRRAVDAEHAGMGVRAPHQAQVQDIGQLQVVEVSPQTGDEAAVLPALERGAELHG